MKKINISSMKINGGDLCSFGSGFFTGYGIAAAIWGGSAGVATGITIFTYRRISNK